MKRFEKKKQELENEKIKSLIQEDFKIIGKLVLQKSYKEIIFKDDKYYYKTMKFLDGESIVMKGVKYVQFKKHLELIKKLEDKHGVDFKCIYKDSSKSKVNSTEWLNRLNKLNNKYINPFIIKNKIIRSPIVEGEMLSMQNLDIDKYKEFFKSFLGNDTDYHLTPSDFIEAVIINKDGDYIIIDHKQIRPYFFDTMDFYLYNMAMPNDKVLLIDKIISEHVDEKTATEMAKISNYEATVINHGSDPKYLIEQCFKI